jgi:PQQ-dependent dehydrogenase (methanol/ethanol family)
MHTTRRITLLPRIGWTCHALVLGLGLTTIACRGGTDRGSVADAGWGTYNGGYNGQRYAPLRAISTSNVAGLRPICELKLGEEGALQAGPLVVGDTMFVTTAHTTVALDATNCALRWRQVVTPKAHDVFPTNRGVAHLGGRVYRGTPDGRLLALDAATGHVLWDVQAGDPNQGEFLSSAPIGWHDLIFAGVAGSDWGIRGHMMAFDTATGRERWRFNTIPLGNEPGAETWKIPATARHGGGGQWTSYALDTATAELFVPVANPAPDFAPGARPGDNLYTNSLVVLDAATGALKWYYQLRPHDGFDWDLAAPPMLYGARVAVGSKDGYVYSIDRQRHQTVWKTPVTTVANHDSQPTVHGVNVCPGPLGGVEWNGPAYDPQTNAIFAGAVDWCAKYTSVENPPYTPGELYMGTSYVPTSDSSSGWLTAMDAESGRVKWKFHAPAPIVAGVTPTAGGVVFSGDLNGNFYAFDARDGRELLRIATGGSISGGIVTYAVRGTQYVATTSGNISRITFKTAGSPTMIIMALGAPAGSPKLSALPVVAPGETTSVKFGRGGTKKP